MDSNIDTRRDLAIKRLKAKNELRIHLVTYVTFNLMFVLVWFVAAVMLGGHIHLLLADPANGWLGRRTDHSCVHRIPR